MKKFDLTRFARINKTNPQGKARITSRHIYILPTKYGIIFASILFIMLIGSINYANNLGFILTFILSGMGLATMVQTWRNILSLEISSVPCKPVYKGHKATFRLLFESPKRPRLGIQIASPDDQCLFDLNTNEVKEINIQQRTTRRGWMPLKRITIYSLYPLGLLRSWSYLDISSDCLVYPTPAEYSKGKVSADNATSNQGDQGIGNDDFAGHRAYQLGDPPKQIDWKAAARQEKLMIKLFAGESSQQIWLDWYALPSSSTVENRLSLLTKGVIECTQSGVLYGLKLPQKIIDLGQGQYHQHLCLTALALYGDNAL